MNNKQFSPDLCAHISSANSYRDCPANKAIQCISNIMTAITESGIRGKISEVEFEGHVTKHLNLLYKTPEKNQQIKCIWSYKDKPEDERYESSSRETRNSIILKANKNKNQFNSLDYLLSLTKAKNSKAMPVFEIIPDEHGGNITLSMSYVTEDTCIRRESIEYTPKNGAESIRVFLKDIENKELKRKIEPYCSSWKLGINESDNEGAARASAHFALIAIYLIENNFKEATYILAPSFDEETTSSMVIWWPFKISEDNRFPHIGFLLHTLIGLQSIRQLSETKRDNEQLEKKAEEYEKYASVRTTLDKLISHIGVAKALSLRIDGTLNIEKSGILRAYDTLEKLFMKSQKFVYWYDDSKPYGECVKIVSGSKEEGGKSSYKVIEFETFHTPDHVREDKDWMTPWKNYCDFLTRYGQDTSEILIEGAQKQFNPYSFVSTVDRENNPIDFLEFSRQFILLKLLVQKSQQPKEPLYALQLLFSLCLFNKNSRPFIKITFNRELPYEITNGAAGKKLKECKDILAEIDNSKLFDLDTTKYKYRLAEGVRSGRVLLS